MLLQLLPLVGLEIAAPAMVDSLQVIHPATEAPAHHLSVLMPIKLKWDPCLVHLEEVVLVEVLEVDLVVVAMILIHTHQVEIVTKNVPRPSP